MKIALIADIHSNVVAFDAILKDLKKYKDLKAIVIAGDFLGDGPNPLEAVERIWKIGAYVIKGNRERDIIDYHFGNKDEFDKFKQFAAMKWTCEKIRNGYLDYIKDLPEQCVIDIKGTDKIRVVHGSPRHIYEHLYPNRYVERLDYAVNNIEEKYLVCAHTHLHWYKIYKGKVIINPGSAGISFNDSDSTEYSILEWNDNIWKHSHKYLKYNKKRVVENFYKSGLMEKGGFWTELTLESILKNKNYMVGFIDFLKKETKKRGYNIEKCFSDELWNLGEKLWNLSGEKLEHKY